MEYEKKYQISIMSDTVIIKFDGEPFMDETVMNDVHNTIKQMRVGLEEIKNRVDNFKVGIIGYPNIPIVSNSISLLNIGTTPELSIPSSFDDLIASMKDIIERVYEHVVNIKDVEYNHMDNYRFNYKVNIISNFRNKYMKTALMHFRRV